jgi:hypothetical protein
MIDLKGRDFSRAIRPLFSTPRGLYPASNSRLRVGHFSIVEERRFSAASDGF